MQPYRNEFLDTADAIGARICRDALWSGPRCNWIGASMAPVDGMWQTVQNTLGPDVYSGTSGIALFLGRLASATGDRVFRATALGALRHALTHVERIPPAMFFSLYSGVTGIDYASIAVGEALGAPELIETALASLDTSLRVASRPHELDVVSGLASAIPALLSVHHRYHRPRLLDLAIRLGENVAASAIPSGAGTSWPNAAMSPTHNLTGFSHGTAGFAWALLELSAVTGDQPMRDLAEAAMRYERSLFSVAHDNWPDLRDFGGGGTDPGYTMAWCHGAPGIGLSRLRTAEIFPDDPALRVDADAALRATRRDVQWSIGNLMQTNFSLCHGLSGNAELLLCAGVMRGSREDRALADEAGRAGIRAFEENGAIWPCGVNGGGSTPALMLGHAGIGYFFLRLADPDCVPPVVIVLADADRRAMLRWSTDVAA